MLPRPTAAGTRRLEVEGRSAPARSKKRLVEPNRPLSTRERADNLSHRAPARIAGGFSSTFSTGPAPRPSSSTVEQRTFNPLVRGSRPRGGTELSQVNLASRVQPSNLSKHCGRAGDRSQDSRRAFRSFRTARCLRSKRRPGSSPLNRSRAPTACDSSSGRADLPDRRMHVTGRTIALRHCGSR